MHDGKGASLAFKKVTGAVKIELRASRLLWNLRESARPRGL